MKHILLQVFLLTSITADVFTQNTQVDHPVKNFEKLWNVFDENYAFFTLKNIDWDEIYQTYRPVINDSTSNDSLFSVCCDMLRELSDRHVSLTDVKNGNKCKSGPPVRLLADFPNLDSLNALAGAIDSTLYRNGFRELKRIDMKIPYMSGYVIEYASNDDYGYLRANLMYGISRKKLNKALDEVVESFRDVKGVIIDIRFNSGGYDKYSYEIAGRFTDKERIGHYRCTKSKKGFSRQETWTLKPTGKYQIVKPVVLLTSNLSMSAADLFAMIMKELPHVTIIGDNTYGIFSDMYEAKLPNGWEVTLSFQQYFSAARINYEGIGISPDIRMLNSGKDIRECSDPLVTRSLEILREKKSVDHNDIIAFDHVNLIPMTSDTVLPDRTVIVQGTRIREILEPGERKIPEDAMIIDGSGKYLMPGLADMHVHFAGSEWVTPDANLYLANGVTTVRDLTQGGTVSSIKRISEDFNSKKRLGPAVYNAWTIWGWETNKMEIIPLIKSDGYGCLKVDDYLSRKDFSDIVSDARKRGIYVTGHIPYSVQVDDVVSAGMNELSHVELIPIALFPPPGLDTVPYKKWDDLMLANAFKLLEPVYLENSQAAVDQIKERLSSEIVKLKGQDITVTTTLVADEAIYLSYNDTLSIQAKPSNMYQVPTFWKDLRAGKSKNSYFIGREKGARIFYDMVTYSMKEIRKNKIPVVAGTDAGPYFMGIVPGFSMHDELQLMVEAGYSPFEAISAATCDASKVIEKMTGTNDFGTIETGKRADLILLRSNPFENVTNTRELAGVMTAGIWLPENKLAELLAVKRKFVTPILREVWKQTGSVDSVIAVYKRISQDNYLNTYYLGEYILTNIGYDLLKNNLVDEAIRIFRLNSEEYPTAANPYDCLAEAYLKKGERNLAIDNYKKALRWDPGFNSAIKALKELEN